MIDDLQSYMTDGTVELTFSPEVQPKKEVSILLLAFCSVKLPDIST